MQCGTDTVNSSASEAEFAHINAKNSFRQPRYGCKGSRGRSRSRHFISNGLKDLCGYRISCTATEIICVRSAFLNQCFQSGSFLSYEMPTDMLLEMYQIFLSAHDDCPARFMTAAIA